MSANLLYLVALLLVSPMVAYRAIRHGRYRRGVAEKLFGLSATKATRMHGRQRCIWLHAVSVGEVNLLPRLVERITREHPQLRVVISSSTDTGYDLAVERFGSERVFFCPLDFTWAVKRTLRNLEPEKLVLAELELWPNLVRLAARKGCEVLVVNGRLSERSARRYRRFGTLTEPIFARLSWVGCQDEQCRRRFGLCGTPRDRLTVTGSLKFDDAPIWRETPEVQSCAKWAGVDAGHRVWVVGSTQTGEERMAIEIYQTLRVEHPELRLILVPRHRERFDEVARLVAQAGLRVHRRSTDPSLRDSTWNGSTVILVDTIGELRHWWGVGQIATVGGSFGDRGGQNMLEPAGYGNAVSFGPDTRNFDQIATRLIEKRGAVRVRDEHELRAFVENCLSDVAAANALGRNAREVVLAHRGAIDRTIEAMFSQPMVRRAAA